MTLTETGESRIAGYLYLLRQSLRSFLPREVADDAVREVESHIRERVEQTDVRESPRSPADGAAVSEREAVERVLAQMGPPLKVAQAYSREMLLDEAVTTGRFVPMLRALWHLATTSVFGFAWVLLVFVGWTFGVSFLAIAVIKIVLPNNVGVFTMDGRVVGAGAELMLQPGVQSQPFGYWVVPVSLGLGLLILVGTQRASRRVLAWIRSRRSPARLRLQVEVKDRGPRRP